MPRLPFGIADAQLPSTSGMRGGVVGTPVVQEPGLDAAAAALPGRALAEFGQDVAQTGQHLAQAEAYQYQREHAQSVQDSTMAYLDTLQRIQPAIAERQESGDYKTLPQDVVKMGRDIAARVALERKLSPQAKALFQEKIETVITKAQADSLGVKEQRRQQEAIVGMGRMVEQVQTRMAEARDGYDRAVILGEFKTMGNEWVAAGIVSGKEWMGIETKTFEAVDDQANERAIQADPFAMQEQYQKQLNREPTDPNLPVARLETLAPLHQQASQVVQQRLGQQEHRERMADQRWAREQADNAAAIRAQISEIPLTQENVPKLEAMLADVNRFAQAPAPGSKQQGPLITGAVQREFQDDLRVMKAAAMNPRAEDHGPTALQATLMIDAAENEEDYEVARRWINQHATMMKYGTVDSLLGKIYERKKGGHYSQSHGYREGMRIIYGADITEGSFIAFMRSNMREEEKQHMRTTAEAFRSRMEEIASKSRTQADHDGPDIARKLVDTLMIPNIKKERIKSLDLPVLKPDGRTPLEDVEEVNRNLWNNPHLTDETRWRMYQKWKDYWAIGWRAPETESTETTGTPGTPGTTTGRGKVTTPLGTGR